MVIRTWLAVGVCMAAALAAFEPPQAPASPTTEYPRLWAVEKDGKYGYIERTGRVVIPLQFSYASDFSEGLGAVRVGEDSGYVGADGRFVIPPKFDACTPFSEGLAAVEVSKKWGYIDRAGKFVSFPVYDAAFPFSEGRGRVIVGEGVEYYFHPPAPEPTDYKFGFVDAEGAVVIPVKLENAFDFYDGLALAFPEGRRTYIDRAGKVAIEANEYTWSERFSEELALVDDAALKAGFIDTHGRLAIPRQFRNAKRFSEGLAPAKLDEKWGYIDKTGQTIIPFEYADAMPFSDGLGAVRLACTAMPYGEKDWWTYVDREGTRVMPPAYNQAGSFDGGLAWVHMGGKMFRWPHQPAFWYSGSWRLIDRAGSAVWERPDDTPPYILPDE